MTITNGYDIISITVGYIIADKSSLCKGFMLNKREKFNKINIYALTPYMVSSTIEVYVEMVKRVVLEKGDSDEENN